jgi:predicted nucleic acid-binding protein
LRLIVLDASAIADRLLGTPRRAAAVAEEMRNGGVLHTLDFAYLEVLSALRRRTARGELSEQRALAATADLAIAPLVRHPAVQLLTRVWELRSNQTPYDAAYVALAELLDAPLLTTDRRLARSTGHRAEIVDAGA